MHRIQSSRTLRTLSTAIVVVFGATVVLAATKMSRSQDPRAPENWKIHSMDRPQPPKVDPGTAGTRQHPAQPPSDAIVLFSGEDLSKWESVKGGPAQWTVKNGYMQVNGTGNIRTKRGFGDVQLHIEWMIPKSAVDGHGSHGHSGQAAGNSGVFLMGRYEVQVLNSYHHETYPDGQAAAIYGQYPPLVNASRPPGQWQSYDIIFHRPRFSESGKLLEPATMTVFHNGILVQYHEQLTGPTAHKRRPPYKPHPAKLPIVLQDHGSPVRYRNIWVRPLE